MVLFVVAGCGNASQNTNTAATVPMPEFPATYRTYTSADGWSVKYPETWVVEDKNYATTGLVSFVAPAVGSSSLKPNFGVTKTKTEFTQDLFVYEDLRSAVKTALESSGSKNVETKVVALPAGEAVRGDGDIEQQGLKIKVSQVQMYRDYVGYILTYVGTQEDYATHKADAELMYQSFTPAPNK